MLVSSIINHTKWSQNIVSQEFIVIELTKKANVITLNLCSGSKVNLPQSYLEGGAEYLLGGEKIVRGFEGFSAFSLHKVYPSLLRPLSQMFVVDRAHLCIFSYPPAYRDCSSL